jgi:lipopolysaccharide biosynthesis glycosyltransferase
MNLKYFYILFLCPLFCFPKRISNKQKKIINIAFSLNNKYINYFYTSLYSLLENSHKNTIYKIYIQIGSSFHNNYKEIIKKFETIYFNCFIQFLDMNNDFSGAIRGLLDISTYYRLKLPILCPDITRIIFLDSDTIVLKDLTEFYTLNFENKYILGRLDALSNELDSLGIYINNYINGGVLLMDLHNLRKFNYVDKFLGYIKLHNNYRYLNHHDQTLVNYVCHDKIGILRPKYHMWPFKNESEIKQINDRFRIKYNITEFIRDYYNPVIVHFPGGYKKKKECFLIK